MRHYTLEKSCAFLRMSETEFKDLRARGLMPAFTKLNANQEQVWSEKSLTDYKTFKAKQSQKGVNLPASYGGA